MSDDVQFDQRKDIYFEEISFAFNILFSQPIIIYLVLLLQYFRTNIKLPSLSILEICCFLQTKQTIEHPNTQGSKGPG